MCIKELFRPAAFNKTKETRPAPCLGIELTQVQTRTQAQTSSQKHGKVGDMATRKSSLLNVGLLRLASTIWEADIRESRPDLL